MRTVLVDDEKWSLELLNQICSEFDDVEIVGAFTSSTEALNYINKNHVDVVILDIEMPGLNGINLGDKIKKKFSNTYLIYTTCHEQYALKAYGLDALGYILKPCDKSKLRAVLDRASILCKHSKRGVFIRTFGHFDVFINGAVVHFRNSKAKEMLALLVDRQGGIVTMEQAIDIIWQDKAYDNKVKSLYRTAIADLRRTLSDFDMENLITVGRACININLGEYNCDLNYLLHGNEEWISKFNGEYMMDYSWGEGTLGYINNKISGY